MFTKINAYKKDLWHKKIWEKNFPDLCKPKVNFDYAAFRYEGINSFTTLLLCLTPL